MTDEHDTIRPPPPTDADYQDALTKSERENIATALYALNAKADALPLQFAGKVAEYSERQRADLQRSMAELTSSLVAQFKDVLTTFRDLEKQFANFRALQNVMVEDMRVVGQRYTELDHDLRQLRERVDLLTAAVGGLSSAVDGHKDMHASYVELHERIKKQFHDVRDSIHVEIVRAGLLCARAERLAAKLAGVEPTPEGAIPKED